MKSFLISLYFIVSVERDVPWMKSSLSSLSMAWAYELASWSSEFFVIFYLFIYFDLSWIRADEFATSSTASKYNLSQI